MKFLFVSLIVALSSVTSVYAQGAKQPEGIIKAPASAPDNTNCVKKDKNGKCPALPDSPKPTPKKKAEEPKKS